MKITYLTTKIKIEELEKSDVLLKSGIEDNLNVNGSGLGSFLGPNTEDNKNINGFSLEKFL